MRKTLEQERRFTEHRLARAYHGILEADLSIKTGETDEQLAVDLFGGRACVRGLIQSGIGR